MTHGENLFDKQFNAMKIRYLTTTVPFKSKFITYEVLLISPSLHIKSDNPLECNQQ